MDGPATRGGRVRGIEEAQAAVAENTVLRKKVTELEKMVAEQATHSDRVEQQDNTGCYEAEKPGPQAAQGGL